MFQVLICYPTAVQYSRYYSVEVLGGLGYWGCSLCIQLVGYLFGIWGIHIFALPTHCGVGGTGVLWSSAVRRMEVLYCCNFQVWDTEVLMCYPGYCGVGGVGSISVRGFEVWKYWDLWCFEALMCWCVNLPDRSGAFAARLNYYRG